MPSIENIIQVEMENKLVVDNIKTDLIDFEKEYLKSLTEEVQKGLWYGSTEKTTPTLR